MEFSFESQQYRDDLAKELMKNKKLIEWMDSHSDFVDI